MTHPLTVDFLGEIYHPDPEVAFTIGRDADLVIDEDNAFLHRQFLSITNSLLGQPHAEQPVAP